MASSERAAELVNPFVVASKRLDDGTCTGMSSVNGRVRKHLTVLILSVHEAIYRDRERTTLQTCQRIRTCE